MNQKRSPIVKMIIIAIMGLGIIAIISIFTGINTAVSGEMTSTEFQQALIDDSIASMKVQPTNGVYDISGELRGESEIAERYETQILPEEIVTINELAQKNEVAITVVEEHVPSGALGTILYLLFFGGMFFFLIRMMTNGKNSPMSAGENKATLATSSDKLFKDVIGYEEEKAELVEIIDFLKNPEVYREMGAQIPNGVLLEGPPGTGKTLMAKAVAGEAGVPFYFISGSNFIEMFVGVGASRVRNLFKEARKSGQCIVFIDEIDAIGSRDQGGPGGRNTEQEQTINALLVELDGFATDKGKGHIIIIGATNRADKLDPALLRPGRFDRKIIMGLPEIKAREDILAYHAQKRKISENVNFKELARQTTGMAGAELEAVVNEAAILAVRSKQKLIQNNDFDEAIDRVAMGPAKISNKYSEIDKKMVSYHETGHAIIGLELDNGMKVQKITIVPRGKAGGYVMYQPNEEEQRFETKQQYMSRLVSMLGGRAAEELYIGDVTAGAHSDLESATKLCRAMITEYGMSSLGKYQFEHREHKSGYAARQYSEKTAEAIDSEINKMLDEAYTQAIEILTRRSDDVHLLAQTIQSQEVMTKSQIDYLLEHRKLEEQVEVETYTDEELEKIISDAKNVEPSNDNIVNDESQEVSDANVISVDEESSKNQNKEEISEE